MAENVVVTTLEIKGGDRVSTTMKELKQEIAGYRDELVSLGQIEDKNEAQKERQEEVIQRLQKATKLLTDVTNAHKEAVKKEDQQVDLANDSYNALQARLTKLKKAYKDMVSTERDSPLGEETLQEISQLDMKLKELDAGMGVYNRNVGNYGMTFEQSMAKAKESAGFMQQGLGTLMGAVSMLGVENQGVLKTITALTLAMQVFTNEGVIRSITKVKEWIAAKLAARAAAKAEAAEMKAHTAAMQADTVATGQATTATHWFKKALIATGIGAIIVLIGTLVAYWDELTMALNKNTKSFEDNVKSTREGLEELSVKMERRIDRYKALGRTQEEVLVKEIDYLATLSRKYGELNDKIAEYELNRIFTDVEKIKEGMDEEAEAADNLNEKLHESAIYLREILTEGKKTWESKDMTDYEKSIKKVNEQYQQMYDLAGQIYEKDKERITELGSAGGLLRYYEQLREWKEEQEALLNEKELDNQQKLLLAKAAAAEAARKKEEQEEWAAVQAEEAAMQAELTAINSAIQAEIDAEKKKNEALKAERQKAVDDALAESERLAEKQREIEEKALEEKKKREEIAQEISASSANATSGLLNAVADAIETFGGENEKAQKKAKGVKIAATTIETISGATAAFMSAQSLPFPANTIVGAVQAAAVAATGASNIAKIKATPIGGNGSATPSVSTPSASVSAPPIKTELPQIRNLTSASEEEALNAAKSQKVYILQSEIEAAGSARRAQVAESSF